MEFDKIIDRRLWLADVATGEKLEVCIEIARPYWVEVDIQAACPVFIRGVMSKALDIYGADLLNALECALRLINSELENLPPGKQLQWPGGEPYFD